MRLIRLTRMHCDGCDRTPSFGEWVKGELTFSGYPDWRHPGISFKEAGFPINYENRAKCERLYEALFGRPMPDEMGFLCPECQQRVTRELPELLAADRGR